MGYTCGERSRGAEERSNRAGHTAVGAALHCMCEKGRAMVHSLTCPCMNVCVHLEEAPTEEARAEEELRWVNEAVPRLPLKGLARATKSVAGHTAVRAKLLASECKRTVQRGVVYVRHR